MIDKEDAKIKQFIQNTLPKFASQIVTEDIKYDECLRKGIETAALNAELNFKNWIPHMDTLRFEQLFALAEWSYDKKRK